MVNKIGPELKYDLKANRSMFILVKAESYKVNPLLNTGTTGFTFYNYSLA